jgi:hypothetical protein
VTAPARPARAVVVVYAGDRTWRTNLDAALREAGVHTRLASRPAELAKGLADGAPRLVVAGPTDSGAAAVMAARARCAVQHSAATDAPAAIVRLVLAHLASEASRREPSAEPTQDTGATSSE